MAPPQEIGTDGLTFAQRLKFFADERHLSQAQLADLMDLSHATVNSWFLGRGLPSARNLLWLADYFDIGMRYLLNGPPRSELPSAPRGKKRESK